MTPNELAPNHKFGASFLEERKLWIRHDEWRIHNLRLFLSIENEPTLITKTVLLSVLAEQN
jgi:hypothetical protein